jgi:prepilin-type N-terminal cleavage/methylation domain-containing protein
MNQIHSKSKIKYIQGFTIVEIIIVVGILGIIMLAVSSFSVNVLKNNKYSQDALSSVQDARVIIRTMAKELRSASRGNNGSYPVVQASTSTISFFSDSNGDGVKEQIRYFISTSTLRKGMIVPTGSPLTYNSANEIITTLAYNVKNTATSSLFEYYDNTYAGTSSPLTQPVSVTQVRLVKINLVIDADPNRSPNVRVYTSQVNLRNLKDNL